MAIEKINIMLFSGIYQNYNMYSRLFKVLSGWCYPGLGSSTVLVLGTCT